MRASSSVFLFLYGLFTLWLQPLCAQSMYPSRPVPANEDLSSVLRQLRQSVSELRHTTRNHETEIRTFEEKLHTQETSFDHLRQQARDDLQSQRDLARALNLDLSTKINAFENRLNAQEQIVRNLVNDFKQLLTQSNNTVQLVTQQEKKWSEIEETLKIQSQEIADLETALRNVVEILKTKKSTTLTPSPQADSTSEIDAQSTSKTYKVQAGDNLEKIARQHKISTQQLKEANQLTKDRIIVGQTLKIP